jgi:SulP family sulfate permease
MRPERQGDPILSVDNLRRVLTPELVRSLRGYSLGDLRRDVLAGVTVAIIALPLAMALAIASGATPQQGLITGVVAGFLISAFGGSRYLIGGPTGAFVVVVFNVIQQHGYDGLVLATLMAGLMLLGAGIGRLGSWIKYIPLPVVTGFTSGIAVIIAVSQLGELLGLDPRGVPGDVVGKVRVYFERSDQVQLAAVAIGCGALAAMFALRRWAPSLPGLLIVLVIASTVAFMLSLPVPTIGSRFTDVQLAFSAPHIPEVSLARLAELVPTAFTIAFLAGVESLLCAVVADGMTGSRHRSNTELVGQGIANCASALLGGLPATGAIARTATNIRAGARTPIAGMVHAVLLLLLALLLEPYVRYLPMAAAAAVLLVVAWDMSEIERFRHLLGAPPGDRVVLLLTFVLTVTVDLTVAIQVGVVLASILFMHRKAEAVRLQSHESLIRGDDNNSDTSAPRDADVRRQLPKGVEYLELQGPFFFGVANLFADVIGRIEAAPHACVLVLRDVPLIDASGAAALRDFAEHCRRKGTRLMLAEVRPNVAEALGRMGVLAIDGVDVYETTAAAMLDADLRD